MNINNVFIGYNKNGEELLLYKRNDNYINLLDKNYKIYNTNEISNIILFSNIVNSKIIGKNKIIKTYNNDRSQLLKLSNVFLGNIYEITDINVIYQTWYADALGHDSRLMENNIPLLYQDKKYINLLDNKSYDGDSSIETIKTILTKCDENLAYVGKQYVAENSKFLFPMRKVFPNENYINKKLLLEYINNRKRDVIGGKNEKSI